MKSLVLFLLLQPSLGIFVASSIVQAPAVQAPASLTPSECQTCSAENLAFYNASMDHYDALKTKNEDLYISLLAQYDEQKRQADLYYNNTMREYYAAQEHCTQACPTTTTAAPPRSSRPGVGLDPTSPPPPSLSTYCPACARAQSCEHEFPFFDHIVDCFKCTFHCGDKAHPLPPVQEPWFCSMPGGGCGVNGFCGEFKTSQGIVDCRACPVCASAPTKAPTTRFCGGFDPLTMKCGGIYLERGCCEYCSNYIPGTHSCDEHWIRHGCCTPPTMAPTTRICAGYNPFWGCSGYYLHNRCCDPCDNFKPGTPCIGGWKEHGCCGSKL